MAGGVLARRSCQAAGLCLRPLNAELPQNLHARVDEKPAVDAEEEGQNTYVPDVAITESWDRPAGPVLGEGGARVMAAEPITL